MTVIFISEFMQINDPENAHPFARPFSASVCTFERIGVVQNGETEEGNRKPVGPRVIFAPAILIVIPRFYSVSRCRRCVDWCECENDWD